MRPGRLAGRNLSARGEQRVSSDGGSRSDPDGRDGKLQTALLVAEDHVTIQAHTGAEHDVVAEIEIFAVEHDHSGRPVGQPSDTGAPQAEPVGIDAGDHPQQLLDHGETVEDDLELRGGPPGEKSAVFDRDSA